MLRVYIDFKSPAAYLAMKPTLALAAETGVQISWLPFHTAGYPARLEDLPSETKGEIHRKVRATSRRQIHLKYADLQGIPMRFPQTQCDTHLALAALWHVRQNPVGFAQSVFRAYWDEGLDLGDRAVMNRLLKDSGHSPAAFDEDAARQAVEVVQSDAIEHGIIDAPAYLIADQLFIGREHLPWIRELIAAQ